MVVEQANTVERKTEPEHAQHIQFIIGQLGMLSAQVIDQTVTTLVDNIVQIGKSCLVLPEGRYVIFEIRYEYMRLPFAVRLVEQLLKHVEFPFERRQQVILLGRIAVHLLQQLHVSGFEGIVIIAQHVDKLPVAAGNPHECKTQRSKADQRYDSLPDTGITVLDPE